MAEDLEELFGDNVDIPTFEQILDMDEDDEGTHEFSHSIVFGFFDQAKSTFSNMEEALEEKQLATLSSLGHYLKGSSATIGFTKVKVECEKIQHYGDHKDETGLHDEHDEKKLLNLIQQAISKAKTANQECEKLMKAYYNSVGVDS